MGEFRIRQKMPTRRKKERPSSLPYTVVKQDNTVETIILPAHHLPSVLVLMKLIPPTLLSGGTPVPDNFNGDIWVSYQAEDLQRMRDIYKAKQHLPGKLAISELVQMVAKIAHSHAVAQIGLRNFKPLLLDVIFNKTNIPSHWVGGAPDLPAVDGVVHQLRLNPNYWVGWDRYVVVDVRLFAYLGAPTYRVVVGERQGLNYEFSLMLKKFRKA
jgi:hypothetical protein